MKISKKSSYIYSELSRTFITSFPILCFVFLLGPLLNFFDLLISNIFSIKNIFLFFIWAFFTVTPYLFALSAFICLVSVTGRMNMDKEYWAIITSGIPGKTIMKILSMPALIFMLIVFISAFFLSPEGKYKERTLLYTTKIINPLKLIKPKTLITNFPHTTMYVGRIKGNELQNIVISYKENTQRIVTIFAAKGALQMQREKPALILQNGFSVINSIKGGKLFAKVDFQEYTFQPDIVLTRITSPERGITELTLFQILAKRNKNIFLLTELNEKILLTLFPVIYLFFAFYAGLGLKIFHIAQIVVLAVILGLLSFAVLAFSETISYFTHNVFIFWLVPVIFSSSIYFFKKRFFNVT
ncbi:MAG: LptF/LptG family permease [Candidatus Omnitrophica bacterium]|nr:LptF/LptG family permease [Candidatus Omnitrophota bacterium]